MRVEAEARAHAEAEARARAEAEARARAEAEARARAPAGKLKFVVKNEEPWIKEARKGAYPIHAPIYGRRYERAPSTPKSDKVTYMDVKKRAGKK